MTKQTLQIGVQLALMTLFVPPIAAQAMPLTNLEAPGPPTQLTMVTQMTDEVAPYGEVLTWRYATPAKPKKRKG